MPKKKIIIWGATGQSLVLEEILREQYDIIALFDKNLLPPSIPGVPLYQGINGFQEWKGKYAFDQEQIYFIVAIGGSSGGDRVKMHDYLKSNGLIPVNALHATAFVAYNAELSEGIQVLANASVCVNVKLGKSAIINTGASVDHEGVIGEGVHIGPGAKLAGCVIVNNNTFIGTGAVILPRIEVGSNCMIGAGSVVTRNIPDNVIAYGNPCKIIRPNS